MLNVIDLFCGCGGLSEGFRQAGFNIVGGIDFNKSAIETYNYNFKDAKGVCCDLLEMNESRIKELFGNLNNIDVIIGGPPCQGFSSANRYKNEGEDPRNKLFFEFVKFVDMAKPKAIVIENVRGIVTNNNGYAKNRIYEIFKERGYNVVHKILDASCFGVPQKRLRNFFVMTKGFDFDFEKLKYIAENITVKEAIGELYVFEDTYSDSFNLMTEPKTKYQRYLRGHNNVIKNHDVRYPAEKVQERISYVPQGGNWKDVPDELWPSSRSNRHSSAYKRLAEDSLSVTIDTGNNHSNYFHPLYNRLPTVREAARLQSFSDDFVFCGNRSEQYRQVGNAVPPLLAKAIADEIKRLIEKIKKQPQNKIIDLFCGCGGLSLGFEKAGFEVELAIDMWKDAVDTFNYNSKSKVAKCIDIHSLEDAYLEELRSKGEIVGVIGGPPCQGYSTVGTRDVNDPRNHLYLEYCRIVEKIGPQFFVIENVKGLLTLSGGAFKNDIIERFGRLGYTVAFKVINAADFGVPQNRHRIFFVGMKDKYFAFPRPLDKMFTASDALSDLPPLNEKDGLELIHNYLCEPLNEFQFEMRKESQVIKNHQITMHTEQTVDIISMIPDGGKIKDLPKEYWEIRKYNKAFERMDSTKPSNTVDTGHRNYFHYKENRIPTVRENARLQSFPDTFEILGTKTSQYKQIGNAVPPMLAYVLAKAIKEQL